MTWANRACFILATLMMIVPACSSTRSASRYRTVPIAPRRDSQRAQSLNDQGLLLVEKDNLEKAEQAFREALEQDLYYAPAHNNLGLVLLQTQRYYEAAWEFDYAAKLSPHAIEPRQNLGLLYENLGQLDRAATEYEAALEIDPNHVVAMRHLARAYVKAGRQDSGLRDLLERLLHIPSDREWDLWIRGQLIRLGRSDNEGQPFKLDPAD